MYVHKYIFRKILRHYRSPSEVRPVFIKSRCTIGLSDALGNLVLLIFTETPDTRLIIA